MVGPFELLLALLVKALPPVGLPPAPEAQDVQLDLAARVERLRASGDNDGARAALERMVANGAGLADDLGSIAVMEKITSLARRGGDFEIVEEALDVAVARANRSTETGRLRRLRLERRLARAELMNGDLQGARGRIERVLEATPEAPGATATDLLDAQITLARIFIDSRDRARAHETLLQAEADLPQQMPDDHPLRADLWSVQAEVLSGGGNYHEASALQQRVLQLLTRELEPDDPRVLQARSNYAMSLYWLGNLEAARVTLQQVVERYEATRSPRDMSLQIARSNLAGVYRDLGARQQALAQEEAALKVFGALPENHPYRLTLESNHVMTLFHVGRYDEAKALGERVLAILQRLHPDGGPELDAVRIHLAAVLNITGDHERAYELTRVSYLERLEDLSHEDVRLAILRGNLCFFALACGKLAEVEVLLDDQLELIRRDIEGKALVLQPYELERVAAGHAHEISRVLSFSAGAGFTDELLAGTNEACFTLVEQVRGIGLLSARANLQGSGTPEFAEKRKEVERASARVADSWVGGGGEAAVLAAVRERERVRGELQALIDEDRSRVPLRDLDVGTLAGTLNDDQTLVTFWRCMLITRAPFGQNHIVVPRFVVFVLEADGKLTRLELDTPYWRIQNLYDAWQALIRAQLESRLKPAAERRRIEADLVKAGESLRRIVLDPVREIVPEAKRWIVCPDDLIHLIPLDCLPLDGGLVGDEVEIETRLSTWGLGVEPVDPTATALLAVGGVDYDRLEGREERPIAAGSFGPLLGSLAEARVIVERRRQAARGPVTLLTGARVTPEALRSATEGAAWVHLATHGFVLEDSASRRALQLQPTSSIAPLHPGLAPLARAGLALSGANHPPGPGGDRVGVITAEEISAWPLSSCRLAVLSACGSGLGEIHAGQGVASFQKAFLLAGSRGVITSLWEIPDGVTPELMDRLYTRLWSLSGDVPARTHRELWEAKMQLRRLGRPYASWAGWTYCGQ